MVPNEKTNLVHKDGDREESEQQAACLSENHNAIIMASNVLNPWCHELWEQNKVLQIDSKA